MPPLVPQFALGNSMMSGGGGAPAIPSPWEIPVQGFDGQNRIAEAFDFLTPPEDPNQVRLRNDAADFRRTAFDEERGLEKEIAAREAALERLQSGGGFLPGGAREAARRLPLKTSIGYRRPDPRTLAGPGDIARNEQRAEAARLEAELEALKDARSKAVRERKAKAGQVAEAEARAREAGLTGDTAALALQGQVLAQAAPLQDAAAAVGGDAQRGGAAVNDPAAVAIQGTVAKQAAPIQEAVAGLGGGAIQNTALANSGALAPDNVQGQATARAAGALPSPPPVPARTPPPPQNYQDRVNAHYGYVPPDIGRVRSLDDAMAAGAAARVPGPPPLTLNDVDLQEFQNPGLARPDAERLAKAVDGFDVNRPLAAPPSRPGYEGRILRENAESRNRLGFDPERAVIEAPPAFGDAIRARGAERGEQLAARDAVARTKLNAELGIRPKTPEEIALIRAQTAATTALAEDRAGGGDEFARETRVKLLVAERERLQKMIDQGTGLLSAGNSPMAAAARRQAETARAQLAANEAELNQLLAGQPIQPPQTGVAPPATSGVGVPPTDASPREIELAQKAVSAGKAKSIGEAIAMMRSIGGR